MCVLNHTHSFWKLFWFIYVQLCKLCSLLPQLGAIDLRNIHACQLWIPLQSNQCFTCHALCSQKNTLSQILRRLRLVEFQPVLLMVFTKRWHLGACMIHLITIFCFCYYSGCGLALRQWLQNVIKACWTRSRSQSNLFKRERAHWKWHISHHVSVSCIKKQKFVCHASSAWGSGTGGGAVWFAASLKKKKTEFIIYRPWGKTLWPPSDAEARTLRNPCRFLVVSGTSTLAACLETVSASCILGPPW